MLRSLVILVVACVAAAPGAEPCRGPAELERAVAFGNAEAITALGYWFAERGRDDCALDAYRRAVGVNEGSVAAHYNLGVALLRQGDGAGAAEQLAAAAKLDPENPLVQAAFGAALSQLGRKSEAIAAFEAALRADPENEMARAELARLQAPPRSAGARAAEALRRGDFPAAEAAYREYLRGSPNNAAVYYNLAVALLEQGKSAEALESLHNAVRLRPEFAAAWLRLGVTLTSEGRYAEAEAALRKTLDLEPDHVDGLTALGMVLARQRRFDDAITVLRRVVPLRPDAVDTHLNLGMVLSDKGLNEEAMAAFREAVRLAPDSGPARFHLGRTLFDVRRFEDGLAELSRADELQPDDPSVLRLLGMTLSRLERMPEAAAALRRSIELQPRNDISHEELGRVLLKLGEEEEGIAALKRAVELNPRNSAATATLLTRLYRARSDEVSAYRAQMQKLKKEEGATSRAEVLSNFALDAAEAEDWDKAVGQLEEALDVCAGCPIQPLLHENLGLIRWRAGELARAVDELGKAQALAPDDPDIAYALKGAQAAARSSAAPESR